MITQYGEYNVIEDKWSFNLTNRINYIYKQLGVNKNTYYSKVKPMLALELINDDIYHSIMMPAVAFDDLELAFTTRNLDTPRKKTLTRVFIYMYFFIMWSADKFGRTREKIAADLVMNPNDLSWAIGWLVECGFLSRTRYTRPTEGKPGLSREYAVPNRKYWTEYYRDMQQK